MRAYPRPTFDTIIEPFAGSAGYATAYPSRKVILVEKNPVVAELWRWLIGASEREILSLPLVKPGVSLEDLRLSPGPRALIGFWLGDGDVSPRNRLSQWAESRQRAGDRISQWGEVPRARVAAQVSKIRHWTVIEGDYTAAPDCSATWFIDPPYQRAGTAYVCSARAIDFRKLGEWCRARRGQVMVCENEGADWLPFRRFRRLGNGVKRGGRAATMEVLWRKN